MRLWGLLAGTVAATAFFAAIVIFVGTTERGVSGFTRIEDRELFPELRSRLGQVKIVEIKSSNRSLVFERADDEWRFPQQHKHPVRTERIENLLQSLRSLRADYVSDVSSGSQVSEVANPDASTTGAVRVRLLSPERDLIAGAVIGHELTVPVGAGQARMLVRREPGEQAWLGRPVVRVETNGRDWLRRDIVDVPRGRVTRLAFTPRDGNGTVLQRSKQSGLHVAEGIAGDDLAGAPQLEAIAGALERLQFDDVHPLQPILDRSRDDGRTVVATADGPNYTIRWLSENDREMIWAAFSADVERSRDKPVSDQAQSFNARHAAWAYKLPAYVVQHLRTSPSDLGHTGGRGSGGAR